MNTKLFTIKDFYGGQIRDDKGGTTGSASNVEEVNIFSNKDYIEAEQIMTSDALPASTEVYSYCSGDDDTMYAYGKETAANKVRLLSVATGGATNPSTFATLATESDTTNLATMVSGIEFLRSTESSNATSLYFVKGTSTSWYIARYNIGAAAFQRWTGSAWSASGAWDANSQLTGLNGTNMRPTIKRIFNDLYIAHGQYLVRITDDTAATFTEKKFTAPSEWEIVDFVTVADLMILLCRNKNVNLNETRLFWWDMNSATQYEDFTTISSGGAQWIVNHNETIKIMCAKNGVAHIYQLTTPYRGGIPVRLPNVKFSSVGTEATTTPISSPKGVAVKDGILHFVLYKTDKSGIYAIGRIDDVNKPNAVLLSKRLATTSYATHTPYALYILGSNFYAAFSDNGTASMSRCETLNSPSKSSTGVWESVWLDFDAPYKLKTVKRILVSSKPLGASTDINLYVATDYTESYTQIYRGDGTSFNTASATIGHFMSETLCSRVKAIKVKVELVSNTTTSPQVQAISFLVEVQDNIAED